ncbi:MAG: hypothetical protein KGZ97_01830 [Bacteroidetes bacterium]|nr:hypothetical protein [Bacteroidota bacterium]
MKKLLMLSIALLIASTGFSQKIKLISGSLSSVKGEDVLEIQFTYDNMRVGKMTEEDYVRDKRAEADKKDGDGGDRWHNAWLADRDNRFEPKFIELFNKYAAKADIIVDQYREDTKYIMVVNTYFIEPGFNVGISSKPAFVNMKISFVERSNPDRPVAVFDIIQARGSTAFDLGHRVQESYALAGKKFGAAMKKFLK